MTDDSFGRFFLPGPTSVRPAVLAAVAKPVVGHRGRELSDLLARCDPVLRDLFRTERPVFVATASATGFMEAAVRNGVRGRALALTNGTFGERFRDLVTECGREQESCAAPWGEPIDPDEVERRLHAGGFDAVTVVHSESSTGVLNPLPEIAEAVRAAERATGEEILLLVDGVSSVGGALVETDDWGLDFLLTGSQKALALPPGLCFGSPSARLLERAATLPDRGRYFDLLQYDRAWMRHEAPTTPAVNLLYALGEQLAHIAGEGVEQRVARHARMAERCWEWAAERGAELGVGVVAPEGFRSPTVTALRLPDRLGSAELVRRLARRGFTIGAGRGSLAGSTVRIGHMGDHTVGELDALLAALGEALTE